MFQVCVLLEELCLHSSGVRSSSCFPASSAPEVTPTWWFWSRPFCTKVTSPWGGWFWLLQLVNLLIFSNYRSCGSVSCPVLFQVRSPTSRVTRRQLLCLWAVIWTCRLITAGCCGDTPSNRLYSSPRSSWWGRGALASRTFSLDVSAWDSNRCFV